MSNKKLSQLAVVAAIMVIAAVAVHHISNQPAQPPQTGAYLIQGLDPDKVAAIVIKADRTSLNLQRRGATFVVAEKNDYPAMTDRINQLLTEVLDIKTQELITDKSENHPDLQVTEEQAQTIVRFLNRDVGTITGIVIGKAAEGGSYARLIDDDKVYLCENVPSIRAGATDYIDQQLISAKREDIISVTVTDANGLSYTLESEPNSSDITLAGGLPEGKKPGPQLKSVFSALTSLRFEDVVKAGSEPNNVTFNRTYICTLKDSTQYILKLAKTGNKTYAACSAIFGDTEQITIDPTKPDSDEQLKKKEAKLLAREAVDKLNAKCKGWVYELPSWKAQNLTKPLSNILENTQPEKPESTAEANTPRLEN